MKSAKPHGISIKEDLLLAAKERAIQQGRSFSGYVCWLLMKDIQGSADGNKLSRQGNRKRGN